MRFFRCACWIVILMVLSATAPAVLMAQDAAPAVVDAVSAPWWKSLLTSEAVWNVVGTVLAALLGWIGLAARAKAAKAGVDEATLSAIEAGAIDTYHKFVKAAKAKATGMSTDEATAARAMARTAAIDLAKGPAKDALIQMAVPQFNALLERTLGAMKRSNSTPDAGAV